MKRGRNEAKMKDFFFVYERKRYANSYHRKIILLQNLDFFPRIRKDAANRI